MKHLEVFNPHPTYEGLLVQAQALYRILITKERINKYNIDKINTLERQLVLCDKKELDNQRNINQKLTNQIEYLENELNICLNTKNGSTK